MVSQLLSHAECTLRHFLPDQRWHELEVTVVVQRDAAEEAEVRRDDDPAKAGQVVRGDGASAYALLRRTKGGSERV